MKALVGVETSLYKNSFKVKDYNLLLVDEIKEENGYINVEFLEPQKGVTPG